MSYINPTDIKSNIVTGVDLTQYIDECDDEIVDLAERLGIRTASDIEIPLHFKVKQYGINYILMRVCEDKMGTCQPDSVMFDKYYQLNDYYGKRLSQLRKEMSVEMLNGTVDEIRDRAMMTGRMFRG